MTAWETPGAWDRNPRPHKADRMEEERSILLEFFSPDLQGNHEMSSPMVKALGSNLLMSMGKGPKVSCHPHGFYPRKPLLALSSGKPPAYIQNN